MTYIYNFGDVGPGDVATAGGKGVGLGGLVQAGLPVPPGFVLSTAAYADFVEANHLRAAFMSWPRCHRTAAPQDYEDASRRIRALFTGGTMPAAIAAELGAAYGLLGNGDAAVAVRSSATAEDLRLGQFRRAAGNLPERRRGGGSRRGRQRLLGFPVDGACHGLPGP